MTEDGKSYSCPHKNPTRFDCEYFECVYEGWESETWECSRCGARYKLYYEDMA